MKFYIKSAHLFFSFSYAEKKQLLKQQFTLSSKLLWVFVTLAVILSVGVWYYYFTQDLNLAYNDARSHLNIGRRVVDNLNPGLSQIGSVWLPLFHLLEVVTIWNDFMYRTGLAGSIISMASYVIGAVYLLKLCNLLGMKKWSSLGAVTVYLFNPNLLYMQTTPMTEALLLAMSIAATYYLLRWQQSEEILQLIYAAFFVMLSTLTRYDGWFLLAYAAAVIFIIVLKNYGKEKAIGMSVLFGTLAGFGVFLWFLWNKAIFGDFFFFSSSEFSAKAQQDVLEAAGRLLTKGNMPQSLYVYGLAVDHNLGSIIFILFCIATAVILFSKRYSLEVKLVILTLFVPFGFNVFALYQGQSVLHLPELFPYTWFNVRYGLMLLPAAALALGILVDRKTIASVLLIVTVMLQSGYMYAQNNIITIQDGVQGSSGAFLNDVGDWLHTHAQNGFILVAASSQDALIFRSGLPMNHFIHEGTGHYWKESLNQPTKYAQWVIMHSGDLVHKRLVEEGNSDFLNNYTLRYKGQFSYVYERTYSGIPLSTEDLQ
jgi:hypothetical protein